MKLKTMKSVSDHTLNSPRRFGVAGAILVLIGVTSAIVGWQLLSPRAASPKQTTSSLPEQPVKLAMLGGDFGKSVNGRRTSLYDEESNGDESTVIPSVRCGRPRYQRRSRSRRSPPTLRGVSPCPEVELRHGH